MLGPVWELLQHFPAPYLCHMKHSLLLSSIYLNSTHFLHLAMPAYCEHSPFWTPRELIWHPVVLSSFSTTRSPHLDCKPWRKGTMQCGKWQVLKNTSCLLQTNLIIDWIGMQFRQASGLQSVLATATPQGRGDGIQGKPESLKGHLTRQIRYMFKWKRK